MKSLQLLDKLIQYKTVSDEQNWELVNFLADYLKPLGFKIQLIKNQNNKVNLLAKFNKKKPVLTFSGHMDTVPAGPNWSLNPYQLTVQKDKLYGLGSCDMKGGIAAFLTAIGEIDLSKLKKGLNLLFTYDEEINFTGIIDFLKKVKLKTKYIIIAEPTNLAPQSAAKGVVAVRITFLGKEAHGGSPSEGINAIQSAMFVVSKINKYFKKLEKKQQQLFPLPFATVNVAKISGGDAINKVPASCGLELEYRTIDDKQAQTIYQQIVSFCQAADCRFKIKITLLTPPLFCKNKKFISEMEKITNQPAFGTNGSNEGSYFCKFGYDCLALGPGGEMAHQANEFITKEQFNQAIELYKKIIIAYCS